MNPRNCGCYVSYTPKPPAGLRPNSVWIAERISEIREAMARYAKAEMDIPSAWMRELLELEAKD